MSQEPRWRPADPDIVWRQWAQEQEVVAFSPRSGTIHLLTPSTRLLLEELASAPRSTSDIGRLLEDALDLPTAVIVDALPALIRSLHDAELIELAP